MKYILVTLRNILWTDKETGEERSCYAYSSSSASTASVLGSDVNGSLSVRVAGKRMNALQNDVTLWLNDLTDAEYDLYVEQGNTQAYLAIDGDVANPKSTKVISIGEYQTLESPQMLFAQAS